ncbi:hypothetical protein ANN_09242 [Periplaneta americana]|uniref:DUF4817 domain-containing protein n=1 Tax=Periplaneta americana TaxID=6978 RepID=A0ABQ8TKV1_PERAM|nr:hypothetical protein ANN_09242 [Periplaneta americana]
MDWEILVTKTFITASVTTQFPANLSIGCFSGVKAVGARCRPYRLVLVMSSRKHGDLLPRKKTITKEPTEHSNHSANWGRIEAAECVEAMKTEAGTSAGATSSILQRHFVKKSYLAYFGIKLGDQSKAWAPHKVCRVCIEELHHWINGRRLLLSFGVPMVWREQSNHSNDCYFCSCDVKGKELRQPSYYRGASRSRWGKSGYDIGKRTIPVRKYDSILKTLSSLENANIFLERTILSNSVLLTICGLGSVWSWNFLSRRGGSEVHSKTQRKLVFWPGGRLNEVTVKAGFTVYYKNKDSFIAAQRLFRRHYKIHRNDPISSAHAIKIWIQNFEVTGSELKNKSPVWSAIASFGIIGPYFFEDGNGTSVTTSQLYVRMIQEFLSPQIANNPLINIEEIKEKLCHEISEIPVNMLRHVMGNIQLRIEECVQRNGMYQLVPSATGWMDGTAPLPHRHNNTDEVRHISFLSLFTARQDTSHRLYEENEYDNDYDENDDYDDYRFYKPLWKQSREMFDGMELIEQGYAVNVYHGCGGMLKVRSEELVILPVVLYGCETWTLTLREEQRLRVFENKVLRKIFGAKRDEVTGEWRKLHNAELHALSSSPDIIRNIKSRRLRWARRVARMGESRNTYRVLVGRPGGKRPLGRPRRRWEDNIKMDLREVGYDGRNWIFLLRIGTNGGLM